MLKHQKQPSNAKSGQKTNNRKKDSSSQGQDDFSQKSSKSAQLQHAADSYVDEKRTIQKKNNTGLPDQLKSGVENLSGYSLDDVNVHYNSNKPAQLQAHAYAQGNQIHIAPGQEKHLPHEAWHVVQQKQGRVKPTKQLEERVNINDDKQLEQEADIMGAKALSYQDSQPRQLQSTSGDAPLQRIELVAPEKTTDAPIIQPKITIGNTIYDKAGSKDTIGLKERMKKSYGADKWKRGWIKYMTEAAASDQEIAGGPFQNEQELANELKSKFPVSESGSSEADFMKDAFNESGLSLVGFMWKVLKSGFVLQDKRVFTKADLMKAMSTREGKDLIGQHWRDTNNAMHGDQVIQGKHEWILTSNLIYVIQNAQSLKDLEIWFMAAEILRTPTQSVIFKFDLNKKGLDKLINQGGKLSDLGLVGAHPGALYQERDDEDEKKKDPGKYNVQSVQGSIAFHNRLEDLLKTYLNPNKNDIKGYLEGLMNFHQTEIWDGTLSGANAEDFEGVDTGFYEGAHEDSEKKDVDMEDFMLRQQKNFKNDQLVLANQAKAILFELNNIESGDTLAVDTKKLNELDEDSRVDVQGYFERIDKKFTDGVDNLVKTFQSLANKYPSKFDEINQTYKKKWQELYDWHIQAKTKRLEETYKKVMKIGG